jgi:hypothetical protein
MSTVVPSAASPAQLSAAGVLASGVVSTFTADAIASSVLNDAEAALVKRALHAVAERAPVDGAILTDLIHQLRVTRQLVELQRPLREPTALGGEPRTEQTLIDHLCAMDGLSGDLTLPLKATLSRTHLLTKIMFLRAFVKATQALRHEAPTFAPMAHDLREELAQSIYTLLAEELLLALLRKRGISDVVKHRIADQLITIWDDVALEIDSFAPLLESAWHARNRVHNDYGTMLGASETFRLVCADCRLEVVDYFARDNMSAEETGAFEEFLFNMTSEELATLRREMKAQDVRAATPAWAASVLGRPIEDLEQSAEIDPMALYRSYQRRQLAADFRLMSGAPGPRRTAEAYLMLDLLSLDGSAPSPGARDEAVGAPLAPSQAARERVAR